MARLHFDQDGVYVHEDDIDSFLKEEFLEKIREYPEGDQEIQFARTFVWPRYMKIPWEEGTCEEVKRAVGEAGMIRRYNHEFWTEWHK